MLDVIAACVVAALLGAAIFLSTLRFREEPGDEGHLLEGVEVIDHAFDDNPLLERVDARGLAFDEAVRVVSTTQRDWRGRRYPQPGA